MRWEAMMAKLRAGTIQDWFADFVDALQRAHAANDQSPAEALPAKPPVVWPVQAVGSGIGSRFH
jgi:trehalose 6-phosphate synthase